MTVVRFGQFSLSGIGLVLLCTTGYAAPLTCDHFRDRLNGALVASGDPDARVPAFVLRPAPATGGKRYDWTSADVSGTMACGPADQFEEFYVSLRLVNKDQFAAQVKRFITLNGSVICTFATDAPSTCTDMGRLMLQEALRQMGAAFNHGSRSPSGLSDQTLFPGVSAELTSAPTLVTFVIGPGRRSSLDEARQPLARALPKPTE